MMTPEKKQVYEKAREVWNPNKIDTFEQLGVDIVMGRREGYCFWDMDGRRIINMHLNGGVYNLGHRNPEIIEALVKGTEQYDAGNHYFPSPVKNELAERLLSVSPDSMRYVAYNNGGGESIDAAVKFARHFNRKPRVVTVKGCFHGATGIALAAGDPGMSDFFDMKPDPSLYTQVTYNSLPELEEVLKIGDTSCVLLESIPATFGFPIPDDGYLKGVAALCRKYGALYIADEVQTGLMRSGSMWCAVGYGAEPDMIVTGKGLSGGIYPMSAVIMNADAGKWLTQDGFAHLSSFGGTEIGCVVASKAVEITSRASTAENVKKLTAIFAKGLADIRSRNSDFFPEIRQRGVIMGIKTAHPMGATVLMTELYKNGVWAIRANFDQTVLQFKAGLLMEESLANEVLGILDDSMAKAAKKLGF